MVINGDPERVAALLDNLPPGIRQEIERLDLRRRNLSRLDAEFLLIHDQDDRAVPATQSSAFAAALAPDRARLYLVEGLDHAQVKTLGAAGCAHPGSGYLRVFAPAGHATAKRCRRCHPIREIAS